METYRLNSKLIENNKEYLIQTTNDVGLGTVSSEIYIDGSLADIVRLPHPEQIRAEEVLSLVKSTHGEKKKEVENLLKAYKEAMESANPDLMYHLGLAFYYKRFYSESRELVLMALELRSDCHEAFNLLAQIELSLGNVGAAVRAAESAVKIHPEYADYRNNLGESYMAAKSVKKALLEFERAIGINLYYGDAYFNYGLTLVLNAIEQVDTSLFADVISRAVEYFTKASLIYPDYKTAAYEKGIQAIRAHDMAQAFQHLGKVREEKKESYRRKYSSYYMKHVLHPRWISEEAIQERIVFLQNEVTKNPTYVDLYAELARCYIEQSKLFWRRGIDQYKKALEINPSLTKIASHVEEAQIAYENICQSSKKIAE